MFGGATSSLSTSTGTEIVIALPSERRALRTKLLAFYSQYEPSKPLGDVNELVEWGLKHGEEEFNTKLRIKYNGSDLTQVKTTSMADLPVGVQLRVFYGEFDPSRPAGDIRKVESWAALHGVVALNERMLEKYGENLNTLCFGGKEHLRTLLQAFYAKHDQRSLDTPKFLDTVVDWTINFGPKALNRKLRDKYHEELSLSVSDIANSQLQEYRSRSKSPDRSASSADGGAGGGRARAESEIPTPQAWNKIVQSKIKTTLPRPSHFSIMSDMTMFTTDSNSSSLDPLLDAVRIRMLVELFYAKHAPQRLVESENINKIVTWTRHHGIAALNEKMKASYHTDLDELGKQFDDLYSMLERFYAKNDHRKLEIGGGLEDIAGWGVVHGAHALNERLIKKYGVGLPITTTVDVVKLRAEIRAFYKRFAPKKNDENIESAIKWIIANSREQFNTELRERYTVDLDNYKDQPAIVSQERASELLSYEKPKATITTTTTTITQAANIDLPKALEGTRSRTSELGMSQSISNKSAATSSATTSGTSANLAKQQSSTKPAAVSSSSSMMSKKPTSSAENTQLPPALALDMDAEIEQMYKVMTSKTKQLNKRLAAFYTKHDPSKLKDRTDFDTIIKWALKHGLDELNERLADKYGESLDDIVVQEDEHDDDPEPIF